MSRSTGDSTGAGPAPSASGASAGSSRSKRKRAANSAALFSGIAHSAENKDSEFLCPICFELLQEAHMTKCGHTFCYECILKSLDQSLRCPKCNCHLESKESIFPNFALNELVAKHRSREASLVSASTENSSSELWGSLSAILSGKAGQMTLADVEHLLSILAQKRDQMQGQAYLTQQMLLKDFLTQLKKQKESQLFQLQKETSVISRDLDSVEHKIQNFLTQIRSHYANEGESAREDQGEATASQVQSSSKEVPRDACSVVPSLDGFNVLSDSGSVRPPSVLNIEASYESTLPQRRQRMHHHFDDLSDCYFNSRISNITFFNNEVEESLGTDDQLDSFSTCVEKFTRYSAVRPLATLSYTADMFNNASIVSSIEFDKDNEFFAIAGVTKRIKIYPYSIVLKDMVDIHYACAEMTCNSKISCIAWSFFHKGTLVSSDYEGTVIVWDVSTCQKTQVFQEHEKRCWSVDFNMVDTKLIASGSDDSRVKLWSTNMSHSVASLEAKANVCCVKFNPTSCYHLAFGSADHCVHYYDLRNTKSPLSVFRGHRKAVSYCKFLNSEELVSASTDSQLKLWNVNQPSCIRSYQGHLNEKNFVGLATDGDYLTCGSENNSLYVYYKGLSKPLFNFKFDLVKTLFERDKREDGGDTNEFVSAVCWRQGSPTIVAANSQGTIKILQLV